MNRKLISYCKISLRRCHALVLVTCFVALLPSSPTYAQQRSTPANDAASWSDLLRRQVGQTLFDAMKAVLDSSPLILHQFTGNQVIFSVDARRRPGEAIEAIERRSNFTITISACPNSNSPRANVASVFFEVDILPESSTQVPELLHQLFAATKRRGSEPMTVRHSNRQGERGLVLEWKQGAASETIGVLAGQNNDSNLRWSFIDQSNCNR